MKIKKPKHTIAKKNASFMEDISDDASFISASKPKTQLGNKLLENAGKAVPTGSNANLLHTLNSSFNFARAQSNAALKADANSTKITDAKILPSREAIIQSGEATVQRVGSEFLVNTTTAGGQFLSSVAAFADGGYVVAWTDTSYSGGDVSNAQVRAQIFDKDGHKVGDEFRVNTTTNLEQRVPKVSVLTNGDFVIVWEDQSRKGGDASGTSLKAQMYHADGTKIGGEFLVNTTTKGNQDGASITALAGGGFVVTWHDTSGQGGDASGSSIKAQLFDTGGHKIGGEFLVNTIKKNDQDLVSVASLANGGFVITWNDGSGLNNDDTRSGSIKAQMFDANGTKVGGEILVDTKGVNFANDVANVTGLSNGGFVVTWEASSNFGADTDDSSIQLQIFDKDGHKVGTELQINTSATEYQRAPVVKELSNGYLVVVWKDESEENGDADQGSIKGQILDQNGSRVGGEFLVNTTTQGNQQFPSIEALPDGRFIVTWTDDSGTGGDPSDDSVKAQIFSVGSIAGTITDETLTGGTVAENAAAGTVVGTVHGIDGLPGAVLTYTLLDNAGGRFAIDGNTGVITVADASLLDFEAAASHGIKVQVKDQTGQSFTKTFNIGVTNVNEAPTGETLSGGTVAGNSANGTVVGTVHGIDPDAGSVLTYTLIDTANGRFAIDANTGVITVADGSKLDAAGSIAIKVRVTDQGGLSFDKSFNVTVTEPVEQFTAANEHRTVDEDNSVVISSASLIADSTNPSNVPLSVTSVGHATHGIVSLVNGNVTFVPDANFSGIATFDYTLSDASGRTSTATVTVDVAPVADAPGLSAVQDPSGIDGAVKIGGENLVNETTVGGQFFSSIGVFADGGYVVTWADTSYSDNDFSNAQVRAQIFDASGNKVGNEFRVNTTTDFEQSRPQVTVLANGDFVIVWHDESGQGGDTSGISLKAQMYHANGAKVGGEFLVNTTTQGDQDLASVTALANGGFVVTWQDTSGLDGDSSGASIKAQLFDAGGHKVGGEFLVNTITQSDQDLPSVASLKSGGFVIVWQDNSGLNNDDTRSGSIKAQIFDINGNKVGDELLVDTKGINFANDIAHVTGLSNGGFVVAWEASPNFGPDTDDSAIKVQFFDASGHKVGGEIVANTSATEYQRAPVIKELANGFVVVVWKDESEENGDNDASSVKAQLLDPNGNRVGGEFLVNTSIAGEQEFPTVEALPDGRFIVTWSDDSGAGGDADGFSVKTQVFSVGGGSDGPARIDITANLADADGSETLTITLSDIPVGVQVTDGFNSFTATAGNTSVDVSTWTIHGLTVVPPEGFSGNIQLTVNATATDHATLTTGDVTSSRTVSQTLDLVNVSAPPALSINGTVTSVAPSGELDFGAGIKANQLWFQQSGNDLSITVMGSHDQMTLAGWFGGSGAQLAEIKTADGMKIDAGVAQLVQAMATYSATHAGFDPATATQAPADTGLQNAIASNWHH